jgi:alpha-D-ribose 1-methylphosphonate 5-triphosphate synthase subunit PhnH
MTVAQQLATSGGLTDPVFDSQAIFSALMNAFARPGTIADLGTRAVAPAPLMPAAFIAAMADFDTRIWLDEALSGAEGLGEWISFQTGAVLADAPEAADFALLTELAEIERFAIGTPAFPDRSATLIVQIEALEGGAGLTLTGPGIETERGIAPCGLPRDFAAIWLRNNALFPLGVDLVLVAGARVIALPRTTRIREG